VASKIDAKVENNFWSINLCGLNAEQQNDYHSALIIYSLYNINKVFLTLKEKDGENE
jgi:hypothetical protein